MLVRVLGKALSIPALFCVEKQGLYGTATYVEWMCWGIWRHRESPQSQEVTHGWGEGAEMNLQDEPRASGWERKRLARASSKRMQFDPVAKKAMQTDLCVKHKKVNVRLMLPA